MSEEVTDAPFGTGSRERDQQAVPALSGFDPSREIVLGFTGSQHPGTRLQREALKRALSEFRDRGALWMHNGDCIEADAFAGAFWRNIGGKVHLHPPSDPRKRAYLDSDACSMPKDYLVRNRDIVNAATHLVAMPLEFVEQARGGTWSTVRYARLRKTPAMIIRPNGSFVSENWQDCPLTSGVSQ